MYKKHFFGVLLEEKFKSPNLVQQQPICKLTFLYYILAALCSRLYRKSIIVNYMRSVSYHVRYIFVYNHEYFIYYIVTVYKPNCNLN